jgi:hypothetical protein
MKKKDILVSELQNVLILSMLSAIIGLIMAITSVFTTNTYFLYVSFCFFIPTLFLTYRSYQLDKKIELIK